MVEHVSEGLYLLNDGDNATSVAKRLYGDPHKGVDLLQANPTSWDDLERVRVPHKRGRTTTVQEGEGVQRIIARMFPNQPVSIYIQPFSIWNGGSQMNLRPGDLVFVPER